MADVDFGVEGEFDSAPLSNGGHLHPTTGFFAILVAFVAHAARRVLEMATLLSSAESSNGVLPGTFSNVLISDGAGSWLSEPIRVPVLASHPSSPKNGQTYFNSTDGVRYTYYAPSTTWVEG